MKRLFTFLVFVGALLLMNTAAFAQCELSIFEQSQSSGTKFKFTAYVKNTSAAAYGYFGGSYGITFNSAIVNGGTFSVAYLSSDMPSNLRGTASAKTSVTPTRFVILSPSPQDGGPMINAGDSIKVFEIEITSTATFGVATPNLTWKTSSPDPTKIYKYTNGNTGAVSQLTVVPKYYHVNAALPVELTSFTNLVRGRDVRLDWKTATEVNSSKFEIERASINESGAISEYAKIATVAAHGISNVPVDYSYSDRKLNAGKYSYRLKMIDADGTVNYSKIQNEATVALPDNYAMSQNYPNPFNPSTKIDYQLPQDASVTLELYTVSGEKIATLINGQEQPAGFHTYNFSSNQANHTLASGMYLYRLIASGKDAEKFVSVKKMILMK